MKRTSIAYRLNLIMVFVALIIISFSAILISVGYYVDKSSNNVANVDIPLALNSLAMLEEFGDMNSNLLEYLLGEEEEKQEYFGNYEEFLKYRRQMPTGTIYDEQLSQLETMVSNYQIDAKKRVFNTYNPTLEKRTTEKVRHLMNDVGIPLESLLDEMKEEEIADVGSANSLADVIEDDLPGVRFYLELVDEAGDMLADLDRFTLGDIGARKSFYENALSFERYFAKLKPLEQKEDEIIRIKEIERLFYQLKKTGSEVFENYAVFDKNSALLAVDELEHQVFGKAELMLDNMSEQSRIDAQQSMASLKTLADNVNLIMVITTLSGIALIIVLLTYTKQSIFIPINTIAAIISRLRKGERNFSIKDSGRNDEMGKVIGDLKQFQIELIELDDLRDQEQQMRDNLANERDKAQEALSKLELTQDRLGALERVKLAEDKLAASEKLASLGSLVAGVAHEVNTPLGVGVTMSTTLEHQVQVFVDSMKSGQVKKSDLEVFENNTQKSFKLLVSALEQASHLISNFKQVAVDQTSSKRRDFNVYKTLEEVLSTLHHQVRHTNIKCEIQGDKSLVMDSFPGPLGQVITNLFSNAVAHAFENKDDGEININYEQSSDNLVLSFNDNGCGIPSTNLKRIYEPFYTTKLGRGGSGLGLNIVHNIVTGLLAGSINVSSSETGTVFTIIIPLTTPHRESVNE